MKLGERLCAVLCIIGMFMAGCGGLLVYLLDVKNMKGTPLAFSIFVIGIVLFLGSFFYDMRYYGE